MKASEAYTLVKNSSPIEGLGEWIEAQLIPEFVKSGRMTISVGEVQVQKRFDYVSSRAFISAMEALGYKVKYQCEDRPCGGCWFEITIPEPDSNLKFY